MPRKRSKPKQKSDAVAAPAPAVLNDPHHTRADLRLIRRAIQGGWPITDQMRAALPQLVFDIASDTEEDARTRVGAASTLERMEAANQRDLHKAAEFARLDAGGVTERHDHTGHMAYVAMPEDEI